MHSTFFFLFRKDIFLMRSNISSHCIIMQVNPGQKNCQRKQKIRALTDYSSNIILREMICKPNCNTSKLDETNQ